MFNMCTTGDTAHIDLADLKAWIISAVKNIDASMLTRVEYRIDVCRVTRGAPIELF
jgi:hypothetical protein